MADNYMKNRITYQHHQQPHFNKQQALQTQTVTSVTDDSYIEIPHKPNQQSELNSHRMMQPRKGSEQILKTINNLKLSESSLHNMHHEFALSKDQISLTVLSEGATDKHTKSIKSETSQSSLQQHQLQVTMSQSVRNKNQKPTVQANTLNKNISEKRSSINNYHKRVVELHLNNHIHNNESNIKVLPSTMKNKDTNQISLDMSEIPILTTSELSTRFNEIKQEISNKHLNNPAYQSNQTLTLSNEKPASAGLKQPQKVPISTNLSPKGSIQTLFQSPRHSINQINNTITKSKLMLRKQVANNSNNTNNVANKNGLINLNKSDQINFNTNLTQDGASVNQSQNIQNFKYNSPQLSRFTQQSKTNKNSSIKKQPQISSQSSSQLLRNLSQEHKNLRISESSKELMALKGPQESMDNQRNTQQFFESKRESLRYYSPTQMSLNKALSRISSVNELKKVSDKIEAQRKSIHNNNGQNKQSQQTSQAQGLTTLYTAQIVMNNQKKPQQEIVKQNKSLSRDRLNDKIVASQQVQMNDQEENDYMTNQEKLWNAIETNQDIQVIEELLKKKDVSADAKNIFDDGWTALHYAVHEGLMPVVKLLVEQYNAQVDPRSSTNKTPFHLACIRGEEELICYLLDHNVCTSTSDRDGCTPLHYLCETENHNMIKLLLPISGASKDIRNRFGKKPVDLVQDKDMKKLIRCQSSRRSSQANIRSQRDYQQRTSLSRERSLSTNNHQNTITVHKLNNDKDVQDGIAQLFKKLQLHQKHKINQISQRSNSGKRLDKTNEEKDKSLLKVNGSHKQLLSPNNPSQFAKQQLNQHSRLTLGAQSSANLKSVQNFQSLPQSTRNVKKPEVQKKMMFHQSSTSNLLSKNISPIKNLNQVQKKPQQQSQQTLNTSQSQRTLLTKPGQQQTQKTSQKFETSKRLTSIKSVANLIDMQHKQLLLQQQQQMPKKIVEEENDDDYNIIKIQNKEKDSQIQSQNNHESQHLSDGKLEDQATESQRTGESSHIINNDNCNNTNSEVNKNHKLTTFSLNQFSDAPVNENNSEDKPKEEQKIGPWSFIAHQLLGTGSFGEVFLVEKISSGKFYAMKVLTKSKIMGHNLTRYAMTERNVMSIVNHPFIVRLNYAFQTQEKLFLILDYCPGGDLAEYLQLEKRFNEDKAKLYSSEILIAIEELHRKDIIFRDLKPDNVVLDSEGHAMLTDFGLSKEGVMKEGMAKSFCGSYAYLAPEMLKKVGHGKAVDWYLLGVIIYEMLCGVPPYYANNKEELFENIKNATLDLPSYLSMTARDIIVKLLNRNPKKRLGTLGGAEEIKKHPFFKGIDWQKLFNRSYKAPDPYLKKRFDNFLKMSPALQTNAEVYEQLRKQALYKTDQSSEYHVPGWSFISPVKDEQ